MQACLPGLIWQSPKNLGFYPNERGRRVLYFLVDWRSSNLLISYHLSLAQSRCEYSILFKTAQIKGRNERHFNPGKFPDKGYHTWVKHRQNPFIELGQRHPYCRFLGRGFLKYTRNETRQPLQYPLKLGFRFSINDLTPSMKSWLLHKTNWHCRSKSSCSARLLRSDSEMAFLM